MSMGMAKEEKLFGLPKWDVEEAARNLEKASELKKSTPKLYDAAIKYLGRRHTAIEAVIRAARKSTGN